MTVAFSRLICLLRFMISAVFAKTFGSVIFHPGVVKSKTCDSGVSRNLAKYLYLGHRQYTGIKVLMMVLNLTFALVSLRKLSSCLQNFVFTIYLNFCYFFVANYWRKIILPPVT